MRSKTSSIGIEEAFLSVKGVLYSQPSLTSPKDISDSEKEEKNQVQWNDKNNMKNETCSNGKLY